MLLQRLLSHDRGGQILLVLLLAVMVLVPVLNLAVPADSPFHLSTTTVTLLGKYLCYALLALALDLIWGYCGILSLGHAAFFGLGGYAMGMYLMRQIGDRGVYGNAELPDFMVFLNWQELPWYWLGFDQFWFAALMVVLVPGLLAGIFGYLAFRSRVTGVYLSIITQALTVALMLAFELNSMGFGGTNGLTDFKEILGAPITADSTRVALCVASALMLALAYLLCRAIVTSRYGRIVLALRDAESRTRFCGYKVEHFKLWLFVFSAVLAAIAGALYVPQVGIINPGEFKPLNSIELVVWVAVGGRATLYGAVAGAFSVNYAKTWLTSVYPEAWLFALGALFVLVTLFLPKGLVGVVATLRQARADGSLQRNWQRLASRFGVPTKGEQP
ncbi:MAG: urea ABC transporter permease subunit UrtC [Gammaproteobacteria bacterium]|nr:urea ABC transporter permease subunit UrtC [Gammaproteobacteria bacterium]